MPKFAKKMFKRYFEVFAFTSGLILMAMMDPNTASGPGFCILERLGFAFCPGDGLGHSIAYIARGEFYNAIEANILGPFALIILSGRILHLIWNNLHMNKTLQSYGSND